MNGQYKTLSPSEYQKLARAAIDRKIDEIIEQVKKDGTFPKDDTALAFHAMESLRNGKARIDNIVSERAKENLRRSKQ
jgi:hypothetical protein